MVVMQGAVQCAVAGVGHGRRYCGECMQFRGMNGRGATRGGRGRGGRQCGVSGVGDSRDGIAGGYPGRGDLCADIGGGEGPGRRDNCGGAVQGERQGMIGGRPCVPFSEEPRFAVVPTDWTECQLGAVEKRALPKSQPFLPSWKQTMQSWEQCRHSRLSDVGEGDDARPALPIRPELGIERDVSRLQLAEVVLVR